MAQKTKVKKAKPKKLLTKADVQAIKADMNRTIRALRKGVENGHHVQIDNRYLLMLLERSRRAIIQLNRSNRDYS